MKLSHSLPFLSLCFLTLFLSNETNAEKTEGISNKTERPLKGKISNLPVINTFFTGRENEIQDITRILDQDNIVVIQGISGIGKSQLAKKYAHAYAGTYNLIWWFDSDKNMETQIDGLLNEIFQRKNRPYYRPSSLQDLVKKLRHELIDLSSSYLLVFDNVDDIASMNPYGPLKGTLDGNKKHVIVTHKKMNNTYPALMIDKFQRNESLAFLAKILAEEKPEDLNQLAEALEDLPLALAQAASYIKMNPSINIKIYLELLRESRAALWESEEKNIKNSKLFLDDHYNKSMVTAIKMNIDSLKKHSPLAYDLLCVCSLLHHHHIPLEVLETWACEKRGALKIEFHEALSLLLNYFVLEKEKKASQAENNSFFSQHELIQLITLDSIDEETKKRLLKESTQSLLQELVYSSETLYEQFKEKEHFSNHMEKICQLEEEWKEDATCCLEFKIALLYFIHFIQHDFDRAMALMQPIKDLVQTHMDLSPLAKVWLSCIIVNDRMFEDLEEVEHHYKEGLKFLEKIEDKETRIGYLLHLNIDYVESLSNFGKIKKAISVCDSLENILKTTENKAEKIAFLSISALVRLKHGQYEQALRDVAVCLGLISEQKGTETYIPFLMVTKANSLLYQGEIEKAYNLIEEYYPHLLEVYASPECVVLVRAQLVKGACLASLGKVDEASDIIQQSLIPYEQTSGFGKDSLKGMGYRLLGEIFETKSELDKAHNKYIKAEALYETILKEKTLDELGLLYTRLAVLGAKQGDDRMVEKYLALHIENFGLTHPRTFEIKRYLDSRGLPLP